MELLICVEVVSSSSFVVTCVNCCIVLDIYGRYLYFSIRLFLSCDIQITVLDVSSLVEKNECLEKGGIRLKTRLNMTRPPTDARL